MKKKESISDRLLIIFCYTILTLIAFVMLYPFWDMMILSISNRADSLKVGWRFLTLHPEFGAYMQVLESPDIWRAIYNSVVRVILGTSISVFLTALTAYPLSKRNFTFNRTFTFLILFTMMFNGGLIPTYMLMKQIKLIDSFLVLILPGAVSAYNLVIMRNFLRSVPDSLEESAKIDGASDFTIWLKIIMPLSTAVLATIALWSAVAHWNAYFDALVYINDRSKYVLQIILRRVLLEQQGDMFITGMELTTVSKTTAETSKAALVMISTLPIVAIYPFLQKYFVSGIMLGSVKG